MSGPAREAAPSTGNPAKREVTQRGLPAAPGIVIGPAFIVRAESISVPDVHVDETSVDSEVERFTQGILQPGLTFLSFGMTALFITGFLI